MADLLTNTSALFKVGFGKMKESMRRKQPLLEIVKGKPRKLVGSGKYMEFPVHLRGDAGTGSRGEGLNTPVPTNDVVESARVRARNVYGVIRCSGQELKLSESDEDAFASYLTKKKEWMSDELAREMSRQIQGDGSGILCRVTSTGNIAPHTVDGAGNQRTGAAAQTPVAGGTHYLRPGMQVACIEVTIATGAYVGFNPAAIGTILSTTSPNTCTFSAALNIAAAGVGNVNVLVRASLATVADYAYSVELWGLNAAISQRDPSLCGGVASAQTAFQNDAYLEISRTTYDEWASVVKGNSGVLTPLTPDLLPMHEVIRRIHDRCGEYPTHVLMAPSVYESYISALSGDVRYEPQKIKGGFLAGYPSFAHEKEMPIVRDPAAAYNQAQFINVEKMEWLEGRALQWDDIDGSILHSIPGTDLYEAKMVFYGNLGFEEPYGAGKLVDIETLTADSY